MDNQEPSKLSQENAQARAANMSYGQWKALQPRQEAKPEELPEGWKRCEYCGKPFKKRYGKRFCDIDCRNKAYEARAKVMRADYNRRCMEKKVEDVELTEIDYQVIMALADSNMNESEASRALNIHRNTFAYHEGKVERITGLDPTNFHDLCKLVQMAKGRSCEDGK